MVAHLLWEQGVAGSNPAGPTSVAAVVQLVEPQPSKLVVAGSSPVGRSMTSRRRKALEYAPVAQLDRAGDF